MRKRQNKQTNERKITETRVHIALPHFSDTNVYVGKNQSNCYDVSFCSKPTWKFCSQQPLLPESGSWEFRESSCGLTG